MNLDIISNTNKNNHLDYLKRISLKADTSIVVSPFVSDDIAKLVKNIPTIKKITLYTTMQKYDDAAQKVIALYKFYEFCKNNEIDLLIKIDDNLHGKVYLFYDGINAKGFILTSGNFTENGLVMNHEFGVYIDDADKQKEIADIIMSINTYDLSYIQLSEIYSEALSYIKNHPIVQHEKFKLNKLINKKPSIIKDKDMLGFGKNPKTMKKGDVLLLHSVGPSSIVGYYVVISDNAVYIKNDQDDRWPWKVEAECHSSKFSVKWWEYELKTNEIIDEFIKEYPGEHVTVAGGDTLGALQWGRDKVEITKEFAQYVIGKMP